MPVPDPAAAPLGTSPAFLACLEAVSRLALVDRPVLVVGERGTGKELVTARLHYLSPRWSGPLVRVNCAALPESLLDAELFGHEAGAFTGATRRRIGRFERADRGTLVLDEIATASAAVQEKILRAVEYGEIERLGGAAVHVDVRLVAATNEDLPAVAASGRFRADLLDRLAFAVVTLPPLRARTGDVALLAAHFGQVMARELGWPMFPGFSAQAEAVLRGHTWPGNVRELRNVVERWLVQAPEPSEPVPPGPLDPFESPWRPGGAAVAGASSAAVPASAGPAPGELSPGESPPGELSSGGRATGGLQAELDALARRRLEDALAAAGGNQRAAAEALGLGYHQLRRLLQRHRLVPWRRMAG